MRIMNSIANSGDSVNPYRRIPNTKQFSLPTVTKREQNVRNPVNIAEYRKGVVSPVPACNPLVIVNDLNEFRSKFSFDFCLFSFYFSLFSFSNRIMKIG